jgi:hypothetical protein
MRKKRRPKTRNYWSSVLNLQLIKLINPLFNEIEEGIQLTP